MPTVNDVLLGALPTVTPTPTSTSQAPSPPKKPTSTPATPPTTRVGPKQFIAGMVERGWTPDEAAAAAGNIQAESGFNAGIQEQQPLAGRGGYGLLQWTGPRRRALETFAAQTGRPLNDPDMQMDFLHAERTGESTRYGAPDESHAYAKAFTGGGTPDELALRFGHHVERPANLAASARARTAAARQFASGGEAEPRIAAGAPPAPEVRPGELAGALVGERIAPKALTVDDVLFGTPEDEVEPQPMSRLEQAGWMAAGVGVPVVAGVAGTAVGTPVLGAGAAGAGSAGVEYLRQKREQQLGLRKNVSPGLVAFEGGMGMIPGVQLEKLGIKTLVPKIIARGVEGTVMGAGGVTGRELIGEGRWPTVDEVLLGGTVGLVTGTTLGGGGEYLGHRYGGRAPEVSPEQVTETPIPPKVQTTTPSPETPAATHPVEPLPMVTEAGEIIGPTPQQQPQAFAATREPPFVGPPEPPPAAVEAAPTLPPTPIRAEPEPQQMAFEQPSFRKVPGLHEAAVGEPPTAARARDPERLAGEIDAVDREYAHLPPESRTLLKQVKLDQAEDTAWRARETQPVERTKDLADELVFDPMVAAQKARGETWKAEELHAAGSHIADLLDDMTPLAEHVKANPDDLAAQVQLQKKQTELVASVSTFEGAKAETGRALNILKYQMTALRKGDPGLIKAALRRGADATEILRIMQLPTDAAKMKALIALQTPTKWQTAKSFWMSNLLAGPKTLIRNTVGNIIPPVLDVVTTPFAAGVERLRGVPLAERQTFAGEIPYKFQALRAQKLGGVQFGFREALRQASEVFHQGYENQAVWDWDLPQQQWSERVFPNVSPGVRTALEYPGRALAATDKFFRTLNYHMDMFGGAYAQARRELGAGATDATVKERVTDILSRPPPERIANAERNAMRRVYTESGKVDQWLMKGRDIGPMGFVIPFVRTPVAIVRQGAQLTPYGFLSRSHGLAPTARMSAQIRGEAAFGSMLMGGLALGVATGQIKVHGTGPTDPVERDRFYREGHRPNSVEILGHPIGYSVLGPLAQPISLVANYWDAYQEATAKGDTKTAGEIAQQAAAVGTARAMKSLKDQSFVRGLSELNNVLSDPEHMASRFFGGIASGFIPYAGAVRSVTQAIDPTLRQAETPLEYVETQLPGLSQNVPPRLRATGEPIQIEQPGGALGRALLPMDVSTLQSTPVEQELAAHKVRLTFPEGQVRVMLPGRKQSEPLSREDESIVAQAKGQATMRQLEKLIAQPGYQSARPEIQEKRLQRVISEVRDVVHGHAQAAIRKHQPLTIDGITPPGLR